MLLRPKEDPGRKLLRKRLVLNPRVYKPIRSLEMAVKKRRECFWGALRRLHEFPILEVCRPRDGLAPTPSSPPSHRLDYRCIHRAVNPSGTLPSAEDGARDPADQIQLGPLLVRGEFVPLHRRGEATLWAQREPLQWDDACGFGDSPLERFLVFQSRALGRDEPQDDNSVCGDLA